MIRKQLATVLLLAGICSVTGCTGYYSFGRFNGGGPAACPAPCAVPSTSFDVGAPCCDGPMLTGPGDPAVLPPTGATMPAFTGTPRLNAVPQATPVPYKPGN